jgi:hypothetical protein
MELKKFNIKNLEGKARSKHEIYTVMTVEGHWYLPPEKLCTMEFIRDVATGKKLVIVYSLFMFIL